MELEFLTDIQILENRVSKYGHFARYFQNMGILLLILNEMGKYSFWPDHM